MIFSVSNGGIEWSLDFGRDSVSLTVKDLVHEKTIGSQENFSASLELVVVPKRAIVEQTSSASSSYP